MKGWTTDGREVELMPRQEECVHALLSREPAALPARGFGFGWSTVLATAARLDSCRPEVVADDPFISAPLR